MTMTTIEMCDLAMNTQGRSLGEAQNRYYIDRNYVFGNGLYESEGCNSHENENFIITSITKIDPFVQKRVPSDTFHLVFALEIVISS